MSSIQRIIKYCAIALAILLAVGIITMIVNIAFGVLHLSSGVAIGNNLFSNKNSNVVEDVKTIDFSDTFTGVKSLEINNIAGELNIKTGEEFRVDAENVLEGFRAEVQEDGTLLISVDESDVSVFGLHIKGFNNPNSKITLYLPEDFNAEQARIENGAGAVNIDALITKDLSISVGAGNLKGSKLKADQVSLEGGIGSVTLQDVEFKDANFECGAGNIYIQGILTGDSSCSCGVGEVKLDLIGNLQDYDIHTDSGVGTIRVNGERVDENYEGNNGAPNTLDIEGGVGSVKIEINQ